MSRILNWKRETDRIKQSFRFTYVIRQTWTGDTNLTGSLDAECRTLSTGLYDLQL
jgi:hypothetical protein